MRAQTWGFQVLGGEKRHVRKIHFVSAKGEVIEARAVYDYGEPGISFSPETQNGLMTACFAQRARCNRLRCLEGHELSTSWACGICPCLRISSGAQYPPCMRRGWKWTQNRAH